LDILSLLSTTILFGGLYHAYLINSNYEQYLLGKISIKNAHILGICIFLGYFALALILSGATQNVTLTLDLHEVLATIINLTLYEGFVIMLSAILLGFSSFRGLIQIIIPWLNNIKKERKKTHKMDYIGVTTYLILITSFLCYSVNMSPNILSQILSSKYSDAIIYWIVFGFALLGIFFNTPLPKLFKGGELISGGILALIWVIMGAQIIEPTYWTTIATWFSAVGLVVLTAYLVKESMEQRKSAHTPEILVKESTLSIYFHNFNKFIDKYPDLKNSPLNDYLGIWTRSFKKPDHYDEIILRYTDESERNNLLQDGLELEDKSITIDNDICLEVYNVGKGFAKNIDYSWEFDDTHLFNKIYEKHPKNLEFRKEEYEGGTIYYLGHHPPVIFPSNGRIDKGTHNLLTPYESSEEILKIPLPEKLLKMIGIWTKKGIRFVLINYPLKLTIRYQDINNEKYVKKYEINAFINSSAKYSNNKNSFYSVLKNADFSYYDFKIHDITKPKK